MNTFAKLAAAGAGVGLTLAGGTAAFETATNTEAPAFAWSYGADASAKCNDKGLVVMSGSFENREPNVDSNSMKVKLIAGGTAVADFYDNGGSPIINPGETGSAKYNTGVSSIGRTDIGISMTWANGRGGVDSPKITSVGPLDCPKPPVEETTTTTTPTTTVAPTTSAPTTTEATTTTQAPTTTEATTTTKPEQKTTTKETKLCDVRFEGGKYVVYITTESVTTEADGDVVGRASSMRFATDQEAQSCTTTS